MTLEIQVLAWYGHKKGAVINRLMGSQTSPLDNLYTVLSNLCGNPSLKYTGKNDMSFTAEMSMNPDLITTGNSF